MSLYWCCGIIAVVLFVYLLLVLFKPELF
ncbi:MAG: K(+)-transporting ATPase subunit F [Legionellales bacterium]